MKMDLGIKSSEDVDWVELTHNGIPWKNIVKTLINFGAIYYRYLLAFVPDSVLTRVYV
jgi:hypothetical protein